MSFVYKADPVRGAEWARLFAARAPDIPFHIWPDTGDAQRVRYLAAWQPPVGIKRQFPTLEILFSTGAGIDQFDLAALPPDSRPLPSVAAYDQLLRHIRPSAGRPTS